MGDPLFAYLLEDRAARLSWLRIFMEASLRAVQPAGHCEVIAADDGIVPGVIAATGPGNHRLPLGRRPRMLFRLLPSLLLGRPGPGRVRWGRDGVPTEATLARVVVGDVDRHIAPVRR